MGNACTAEELSGPVLKDKRFRKFDSSSSGAVSRRNTTSLRRSMQQSNGVDAVSIGNDNVGETAFEQPWNPLTIAPRAPSPLVVRTVKAEEECLHGSWSSGYMSPANSSPRTHTRGPSTPREAFRSEARTDEPSRDDNNELYQAPPLVNPPAGDASSASNTLGMQSRSVCTMFQPPPSDSRSESRPVSTPSDDDVASNPIGDTLHGVNQQRDAIVSSGSFDERNVEAPPPAPSTVKSLASKSHHGLSENTDTGNLTSVPTIHARSVPSTSAANNSNAQLGFSSSDAAVHVGMAKGAGEEMHQTLQRLKELEWAQRKKRRGECAVPVARKGAVATWENEEGSELLELPFEEDAFE